MEWTKLTLSGLGEHRAPGAGNFFSVVGACLGALAVGCASHASSAQEPRREASQARPESSTESSTESDPDEARGGDTQPKPEGEPSEPVAPSGPSPQELVAEACETNCKRMDVACASSAKICRASCSDYVEAAAQCPVEIYEALSCQAGAEDFMLCSNVSPEGCAKKVLAMQACRGGEVEPLAWGAEKKQEESSNDVPDGWARLSHGDFSLVLPEGAKWTKVDGVERIRLSEDGIDYGASIVSLGGKKVSDGLILRTVVNEVGHACESKLRIHGRYETRGTIHLRFNTPCEGDQNYYGALHIKEDQAIFVHMHRSEPDSGPPELLDALVFGYQQ